MKKNCNENVLWSPGPVQSISSFLIISTARVILPWKESCDHVVFRENLQTRGTVLQFIDDFDRG